MDTFIKVSLSKFLSVCILSVTLIAGNNAEYVSIPKKDLEAMQTALVKLINYHKEHNKKIRMLEQKILEHTKNIETVKNIALENRKKIDAVNVKYYEPLIKQEAIVSVSAVNVREKPTARSKKLGWLKRGEKFYFEKIVVNKKGYSWIKLADRPGYVSAKTVIITPKITFKKD
ncbi:SH3 domain-containing protein [Nitrosophilus labii]|uniref:SH3 domain-containing protein n=1 Tax=Nitrosophilus labii TaxID=2706014 RepID=UPI001656FFEF|nr:SH3 domain-containing protein [Nitrosophilus labii]